MKKRILTTVTTIVLAVVMMGCGGGSGSGSGKSSLKKNEYLGNLPAIYANYKSAEETNKMNDKKAQELSSVDKRVKERDRLRKELSDISEKYTAEIKAENAKLAGKEIPFKSSKGLENLKYEVQSVKIDAEGKLVISFIFNEDFKINSKNIQDYRQSYLRFFAKDGSTIGQTVSYNFGSAEGVSGITVKKDDLKVVDISSLHFIKSNAEKWVDFAGIEFVSAEEYKAIK